MTKNQNCSGLVNYPLVGIDPDSYFDALAPLCEPSLKSGDDLVLVTRSGENNVPDLVREVVKNKETKEPFIKEDRFATFAGDISQYPEVIISEKCVLNGVMVGSSVPNTIRVAPPFTIAEEEIDFGIEVLDKVLSEIDEMCE